MKGCAMIQKVFTCKCGQVVVNPKFRRERYQEGVKTALICERCGDRIKYLNPKEQIIFGV